MSVVVKVVVGCMELSRMRMLPRPPIFDYWNNTRDCKKTYGIFSRIIIKFLLMTLSKLD
jgi:hypothetical protein